MNAPSHWYARTLILACFASLPGSALAHGRHRHGSRARPTAPAGGADVARGRVFVDRNGNGVRDRHERGVPRVSVSNGVDVVRTDRRGRYVIALPPESILFISKPAEYELPVDENNLPQYYYRHYPDGTPSVADFDFPTIESTGPLPSKIDFPLLPGKHRKRFKAMGFADTQARTEEFQDQVREDVVSELIGNPYGAAFGLVAGDVVDDNLALYPRHNAMMGLMGFPIWNVPGNHDMNFRSPDDRYATETFKRHFGPTNFSFNHGDVHFIGLDNVEYKGDGQGTFDNTIYRGYVSDEQLDWLRNDLKHVPRNKLIVVMTHISLITYALDGQGERFNQGDNINTVNLKELVQVLSPFARVYGIAGHDTSNSWKVKLDHKHNWHGDWFLAHTWAEVRGNGWQRGPRDERDVRLATMQDGNPNGYYLLSFDGTQVTPRFMPTLGDPNESMRIVLEPLLSGTRSEEGEVLAINRGVALAGTQLVVNLFDGGERDQVEVSIDGQGFAAMQPVLRSDPFMQRLFERFAGTSDAFSAPQPSSHLWEHPLPSLKAGLHSVRVRTLDEFGQTADKALAFELTEPFVAAE